jgi:hypothetical protein
MYTLLKKEQAKKLYVDELPAFAVSLFIAESFYKFGSFILECLSFLVTWWLISFIVAKIRQQFGSKRLKD